MWGTKAASHMILVLPLSLLLAYVVVPLPRWLIRRYELSTSAAIGVTVIWCA